MTTGSFMIRGKKNFLPPCHLMLGLSFLFKLEDSSIERHRGERRVRKFDDDAASVMTEPVESIHEDEEIQLESGDSDEEEQKEEVLPVAQKLTDLVIQEEKEESSSDEDSNAFPNTHINIEHDTGKVDIKPDPKLERMMSESAQNDEDEATLIQAAPLKVKKMEKKLKPQKKKQQQQQKEEQRDEKDDKGGPKRGQKGKMKKIKQKYGDQDEEDRALVMEILKSSGSGKDSRKTKKQEEEETFQKSKARNPQPKPKQVDDADDTPINDELDMLESLTGLPVDDDELLFAIPVVAPYQTLHNYK